jgi:hypothetical protein
MLSLEESLKHYTITELKKAISVYNKSVILTPYSKLSREEIEKLILMNKSKFIHLALEKVPEKKEVKKKESVNKEEKKPEPVKKAEKKPEPIKMEVKKVEQVKKEEKKKEEQEINNLKKKISKGILLIIKKNYTEFEKLYRYKGDLNKDIDKVLDKSNIYDDDLNNWFENPPSEYTGYNIFEKYNYRQLTNYINNLVLLSAQNISKEIKNKLRNLKVIAIDESEYMKQINRKQKEPTNIFDIKFNILSNDEVFRNAISRINLKENMNNEDKYDKNRLIYKNLPNEKQILQKLKDNNVDFDYFVYIYRNGETTPHTGFIPKKEYDGKGYDKKNHSVYNKNGEFIAKDNDNADSILKILIKDIKK